MDSDRTGRWQRYAVPAAAALSGLAAANVLNARKAEASNPPLGRFLEVDGVRLHWLERGEGPPLALIHGNGAMVQDWLTSGIVEPLAARFRVIMIERPGFGYSSRPRHTIWGPRVQARLLRAALWSLGAERPLVVGHSWGALAAAAYALDFGREIAGLGLMSGFYYPRPRIDMALLTPPAVPVVGDVLRYTISPVLAWAISGRFIRRIFAPSGVTRAFREGFPVEMAVRPSQLRAAAADTALMIPGAAELAGRYGEIDVPTAVIAGDGDRIVNFAKQSERIAGEVPGARLVRVEGAGHMVHHVAPSEVVEAIGWLGRQAGFAGR